MEDFNNIQATFSRNKSTSIEGSCSPVVDSSPILWEGDHGNEWANSWIATQIGVYEANLDLLVTSRQNVIRLLEFHVSQRNIRPKIPKKTFASHRLYHINKIPICSYFKSTNL